ncbi:MAG TPA: hypothetical protein VGM88_08890 [Kofleriaceae bacterium]|jgi:hypothetical protein
MRRLLALVTVSSLGGCATARQHYVGGGLLVATGALLVAGAAAQSCATPPPPPSDGFHFDFDLTCPLDKTGLFGLGIAAAVAGLVIMAYGPRAAHREREEHEAAAKSALWAPPPPPAPRIELAPVPTTDPELRRLTLQARMAARRGQCDGVFAVDALVRERDATFYREQFVTDAPVAACLAQP